MPGTNTDAVLLDTAKRGSSSVIKWLKVPTSADVKTGVADAIQRLLTASAISTTDIKCVTIGTTVRSFTRFCMFRESNVEIF